MCLQIYISSDSLNVLMTFEKSVASEPVTPRTLSRRTLLAAAGTGVVVGLAGCTAEADPADKTTTADDETTTDAPASPGLAGVHPKFGFVGESMDSPAPVEADHEVRLLIAARDDRPVPEFFFEPAGLFVESGDVVKFAFETPDHGVTAYHAGLGRTPRVPEGVPALSSPTMTPGTYWLFKFDVPGVYDLYCPPHESFGMAMRVVVDEVSGPAAAPASTEPPEHGQPRPPLATAAAVLNDAALAPDAIVENGSVSWGDIADESKQLRE